MCFIILYSTLFCSSKLYYIISCYIILHIYIRISNVSILKYSILYASCLVITCSDQGDYFQYYIPVLQRWTIQYQNQTETPAIPLPSHSLHSKIQPNPYVFQSQGMKRSYSKGTVLITLIKLHYIIIVVIVTLLLSLVLYCDYSMASSLISPGFGLRLCIKFVPTTSDREESCRLL